MLKKWILTLKKRLMLLPRKKRSSPKKRCQPHHQQLLHHVSERVVEIAVVVQVEVLPPLALRKRS